MRGLIVKKKIVFICLSVLIITLGIVGLRKYQNKMSQNIFSNTMLSSVNFSLFRPASLPTGFIINKQSIQTNGQIVTYSASDKLGHNIVFSIQQRPATFDFDSFYSKSLTSTQRFITNNGEAAIGSAARAGKVGSLVSGDTWVLVTSNYSSLTSEAFQDILKGLTPAH